ncbi:FMN-dependent NADH-azoreductase [Roseibium sediminicola]|uniref:FMN dependent NADH:quinone oxidoreductase n=1 Tax=Roseibium sediminicola TaxID=2933272 RepID=A0ABT0GY36_9HYPH|nr:NAD(P)H-dependent oxidoreductase [Roseibium sp. CAU 1639]MCK7614348.1 NAD(P)H-dependent oxidoreductase [Roseibium sp. CAU 1639]
MTQLLRINSSSRQDGSHSAAVADVFEAEFRQKHPGCRVITRNVADGSIPFIAQETIEGFYAPQDTLSDDLKAATALSDELIAEIQASDTLLLAVPIYNFSIPAALKAWIDQIMRIGHTFSMGEAGFKGLVKARRAVIVCAYGAEGYLAEEPFAAANFLEPYLKFLFAFLGIETVDFVHVQGTATATPETFAGRLEAAREDARRAA